MLPHFGHGYLGGTRPLLAPIGRWFDPNEEGRVRRLHPPAEKEQRAPVKLQLQRRPLMLMLVTALAMAMAIVRQQRQCMTRRRMITAVRCSWW